MRKTLLCMAAITAVFTTQIQHIARADSSPPQELTAAISALDTYLGPGANGDGWRKFLGLTELQAQLGKEGGADPAVVAAAWTKFSSGTPGLDQPKFVAVRVALASYWQAVAVPSADKLPAAIQSAESQFTPITPAMAAADQAAVSSGAQESRRPAGQMGSNGHRLEKVSTDRRLARAIGVAARQARRGGAQKRGRSPVGRQAGTRNARAGRARCRAASIPRNGHRSGR